MFSGIRYILTLINLTVFSILMHISLFTWAQTIEGIAAIVNDEPISIYDLKQRSRLILNSARVEPTPQNIQIAQLQAMRALVNEKLQLQEARKFKVEVSSQQIDATINRLARQRNITVEKIREDLKASGIDFQTFRTKVKAEIVWQTIVSGRYRDRLKVTEKELNETLKRIQTGLSKPQYNISEIFLEIPLETDREDTEKQAYTLIKLLQKGQPFPLLAQQYSVAPSSRNGGEIGWISYGELRPEIEQALEKMEVGQVSAPISVPGGIYLIALRNKREPGARHEMVTLKQVLLTDFPKDEKEAYMQKLADLKTGYKGCETLKEESIPLEKAVVNDLGRIDIASLSRSFKETVSSLKTGEISDPIDTDFGIQMLAVCNRTLSEENLPNKEQVENRLLDRKLNTISRRYLRDIRRDATIESHLQ